MDASYRKAKVRLVSVDVPPSTARVGSLWSTSLILRNITSNWVGIVIGVCLAFVLAPVTVRGLGNVYYGIWTLVMQITGYLWLFDFGVRESVVKYVAQYEASGDHAKVTKMVRTAVSIYGLVSCVTLLVTLSLALALPYAFTIPPAAVSTARLTIILVGATVAQYFVFNVFIGVLMGLQKFYVVARLGIVLAIVRGCLVYLLLGAGYGIVALSVVQFVLSLVSNLVTLRLCLRALPYLSIRPVWPERQESLKLLNYGKFVLIANVGDKIVFASDSLVIGMFLPMVALTHYAIGGSLIEQFRAFITSMSSVVNPLSSSLEAKKAHGEVAFVVQTGVRAAVLLGLPVGVGFIVLGSTFISLWMGPEYAGPSGQVLALLAIGHLLGLPYYTISGALYGLGRHKVVAQCRIFEGVVNLVLSVLLIHRWGILGVAFGTVIPHVIVVVGVLPRVLARWVPISLRDYYASTYLWPFVASVPFIGACWFVNRVVAPHDFLTFFLAVGASLLVYVVPIWFVALTGSERERLTSGVRRRLPNRRPVEGML